MQIKDHQLQGLETLTAFTRGRYNIYVRDAKESKASARIVCEEREKGIYGKNVISRENSVLVDGKVIKDQNICSHAKGEGERSNKDYCWSTKLFFPDSPLVKSADICYSKDNNFRASFLAEPGVNRYYNILWFSMWRVFQGELPGVPLVFTKSDKAASLSTAMEPGKTHHMHNHPLDALGARLSDIDVADGIAQHIERIIRADRSFEQEKTAYKLLYKFLKVK